MPRPSAATAAPPRAPRPLLGRGRPVALLLPGQGAQQARMAAGLYGRSAAFTDTMDAVFALLGPDGARTRAAWLADRPGEMFDDVTIAQPLLYAVDCALGRMVMGWGVRPVALLGHSVGEMAAATLAGVFELEDGVRLMRDRVAALAGSPPGGMLAVAAAESDVRDLLPADVVVGAVNGRRQLMLAGPAGPLAEAGARLRGRDLTCIPVRARQGFHSPMLAEAAAGSVPGWAATPLRPPRVPVVSAYRPGPLDDATARDVRFWAGQPAAPVHYGPAFDLLVGAGDRLLVEAGPGQSLSTLARRHPAVAADRSAVVALLPARRGDDADDRRATLAAANRIWLEGHPLDWTAVRG